MTQNKPYLVGLTGGIATGKSHLSETLKQHGVVVIDADQISHALTAPGGKALPLLRAAFGNGIFDGQVLNRKALSQQVFRSPEKLASLNAILHPLVFEEIRRQIKKHSHLPALVLDIPLLFETGYEKHCDEVWCAYAPQDEQIPRLLKRGHSRSEALARINSQMSAKDKADRADQVILTTGTKQQSAQKVLDLWHALETRLSLE